MDTNRYVIHIHNVCHMSNFAVCSVIYLFNSFRFMKYIVGVVFCLLMFTILWKFVNFIIEPWWYELLPIFENHVCVNIWSLVFLSLARSVLGYQNTNPIWLLDRGILLRFASFLHQVIRTCLWSRVQLKLNVIAVNGNHVFCTFPHSKVHGAYMGPNWGRQDPDGPHVGPMILAIWIVMMQIQSWYTASSVEANVITNVQHENITII